MTAKEKAVLRRVLKHAEFDQSFWRCGYCPAKDAPGSREHADDCLWLRAWEVAEAIEAT